MLLDNLDKLIVNKKLDNKKIILFSVNTSSYAMKKHLQKKGYLVHAYIDNNDKKILETQEFLLHILPRHTLEDTSKINLINAYKPEQLLTPFQDDFVILIASKYYPSMCQQLMRLGYQENIHIFKVVDFYQVDQLLVQETDINGLKEMTSEEIRAKQMEITNYVLDTCKRHNLNIYMTGGTLLGAVRHKGYIPWDDDVDFTIPMPDYKRLIDIIEAENKYDVYTIYNEPELCSDFYMRVIDRNTIVKRWIYPFLITSGVDIDVFPLIGLPEHLDHQKTFFNHLRHLNTLFTNTFLDFTDEDLEGIQYRRQLRDEILKMIEQYNFYESKSAGYILSKYWEKDIMPQNIYEKTIYMDFETYKFPAPVGYDTYLQNIFGDYMKLPPKEEQYVTHSSKAFYKD